MWTGIINLATKWNNPSDSILIQGWDQYSILSKIVNLTDTRKNLHYNYVSMEEDLDWQSPRFDICQYANDTFFIAQEVKDFSLKLAYQMDQVLNESSNYELLLIVAQHIDFEALKNEICQKEFFDCTSTLENHCSTKTLLQHYNIVAVVDRIWAINRYLNIKTLSQLAHKSNKFSLFIQTLVSPKDLDVISAWHFLNGINIKSEGVGRWIIFYWIEVAPNQNWPMICTNYSSCGVIEKKIKTLHQSEIEKILKLIDQP